jgi:hypothetical protein
MDDAGNPFQLPDIKNALRKKEIEEEIARMAEEERDMKPKIKRSDTKAFEKVRRAVEMETLSCHFVFSTANTVVAK